MSGYLTTHVLDTASGRPAAGLDITLDLIEAGRRERIAEVTTNEDGRTDAPILPEAAFRLGEYELVFAVRAYLAQNSGGSPFLSDIPIRFVMSEAAHYHVPLLLSPYGYTTYRGS
ncbi:5-hydroxyisourate hydrolase [Palleronia aestuarii]|uniref:5-hydroxyisourate hydrolase n=1 Tax=Palleronia aestuarii TaxID=568105 RepID=A0A2W7NLT5_9RHOB|nr:hydroxyisourate hydrolase [Palleronia aestuarii]PZX12252.1 5-hydroxyisourate hydrolase [Palleronia aestuarii]